MGGKKPPQTKEEEDLEALEAMNSFMSLKMKGKAPITQKDWAKK